MSMKNLKHVHPIRRFLRFSVMTKVLIVFSALLVVAGGLFGWARWQDAQNKEFLEQIAADFSALEVSLEQELSVEVDNKSGCFTTSEKFNEGKTACYLRLEPASSNINLIEAIKESINEFEKFTDLQPIDSTGFNMLYDDIKCSFGDWPINEKTLYVECPVPVRAGNADYVRELF